MRLVVLTGASGSGKTTITREFAARHPDVAETRFFDSIGVPSREEMIREFGSGEDWQRVKTAEWLAKIRTELSVKSVLFEGQMRPSFIHDAARAEQISDYRVVLVDCDDQTRRHRLTTERGQAYLASDEMLNWARWLREDARARGDDILDTSKLSVTAAVEIVRKHFD